ncbi:MAG TPA: hypothetical protein VI522_00205, partial [Gammaproteobacteria bacterium]|nr:hypothetical protein [Gammaproteobacteria bacterium]
LFTICDKAGQKNAYEKAKQTVELQRVAAPEIDKRAMQHATLALEAYMGGRRAEFLGAEGELQTIAYARMQWAYFKYPRTVSALLSCTQDDLDEAIAMKLFNRMMNADYGVAEFIHNVFDNGNNKKLKSLAKILFKIELALPGMLSHIYDKYEDYLRDLNEDGLRIHYISRIIKPIETLIDLDNPTELLQADKQQSDFEIMLDQEFINEDFFSSARKALLLDKIKPDEDWKKMIPKLMACYARYPVWVSTILSANQKNYLEHPHAYGQHIIKVIDQLEHLKQRVQLSSELMTLCLNVPIFMQTLSDELAIQQIEYARTRLNIGPYTAYALFCCQFARAAQLDALIKKFVTVARDDKKFPIKLTHLIFHLLTLQRSTLSNEDKRKISEDLLIKFENTSDQFLKYNKNLSACAKLANHAHELSFDVAKTDKLRDPKSVIKFFLSALALPASGANYQDLSFDAVIYPREAKITNDNCLSIPAASVKIDDGYKAPTAAKSEHTAIEINAGLLYAPKNGLPEYIKEDAGKDPYHVTLKVEEQGGKFTVKVAGSSVECMHAMAILTAYDQFIAQFIARTPGINYLSLGTFKPQNVSYFTVKGKEMVYHDKAKWRAHQVAMFNYNSLISKLTNVNQIFCGREKDNMLKLNFACRLFADAVALFQQDAQVAEDMLVTGKDGIATFSRRIPSLAGGLPAPLQQILAGLLAFNSFTQFQRGLFNGQNLHLLATLFGVTFEMGVDNIVTLITKYQDSMSGTGGAFTDALRNELMRVVCGEIDAAEFFKVLSKIAQLP